MMKILVLEDRGTVSYYLEDALRAEGHVVYSCFSILDARSVFEDRKVVDCIIADLNMSPHGLSDTQRAQTNNGMFSAWIWLRDEVYRNKTDLRKATILYSDYLPQFREMMADENVSGVTMIEKREGRGPRKLLDAVAAIEAGRGG